MNEPNSQSEKPEKERRYDPELLKKGWRCDLDQLEMLKRCSDKKDMTEWNEWRERNPAEEPLLEGAEFSDSHLEGAWLWDTHLAAAKLERAHMEGAHLSSANLERAVMFNAHLEGADLSRANAKYAMLSHANLESARLLNANLEHAHLNNTKMKGVDIFDASLKEADLRYAELEDTNLRYGHFEGANLSKINLKNTDLSHAHLEGAKLDEAHLENAKLQYTHLERARFWKAHLAHGYLWRARLEGAYLGEASIQHADLTDADLRSANIWHAILVGATFKTVVVDGSTLLWKCKVDPNTDFRGVGLDICRIDPATKQLLEYNIRCKNWEEWYKENSKLKWLVKPFWWISDYGLSTKRVIATFFILAFIFAFIYYIFSRITPPGIVDNLFVDRYGIDVQWWLVPLRALYFSVVTMTTLGFGDMYANAHSIWGHILLSIQVILGYVLLGALVTRFAVLFTAGGPAGRFADDNDNK